VLFGFSRQVEKEIVQFFAFISTNYAILIDTEKAFGDGLPWIENRRVRVSGKPPLESGQFALRDLAITDHAFAETEKLRDKTLGDARGIESFWRLTMVVETVHGQVEEDAVVALPAFPSIPPTANARFAVGVGGSIPGLFELVPILTRVLAAEVADSLTLDLYTHRH